MKSAVRTLSIVLTLAMVFTLCLGGGALASSGESGASGESDAIEIITLEPETLDELIIDEDGYEFTTDMIIGHVEVAEGAELTADYPVIVFFEESDSVENGDVYGSVQFVCDYDEKIVIVHTNDEHGHIDVEPYVKGLADELKESGEYSLVLTASAGDVYGGGEAVAGSYAGELIPAIMDKVYDLLCPGNNDFGLSGVAKQDLLLSALYEHTITLCANVEAIEDGLALADYAENYESVLDPVLFDELYEKVTLKEDGSLDLSGLVLENIEGGENPYPATTTFTTDNGTVVGVFGLTTTGGALSTDLDSLASIQTAQSCVDALREDGATVVVGVGHTGWEGDGSTSASSNDTNSWQLANSVTGLDAYVDSHSHSIIHKGQGVLVGEDPTLVNQAQSFGYCIGVMTLYIKDGVVIAKDGNVISDVTDITPDEEVQAIVDLAHNRVEEDLGKAVAYTEYYLNGERLSAGNEGGTVRGNETNLGDLMTDVILAACSEKMGVDYDICVYPGYWLRSSIEAGDITLESIQSVFANSTVLYYDTCTATELMSLVNKGLSSVYPDKEENTFFQYSGMSVTYTYSAGKGTPVTVTVGDTLIYDAKNGGIQVDDDWTVEGIFTMTGGEIDSYTGDEANWICHDKTEVQDLVAEWFENHTDADYTILPNTVAPGGRIVEVDG